jgi:predicted amidohydrolase
MTIVVCCQLAPAVGRLPDNLDAISVALDGAAGIGADIVVLPELATSGYCFESVAEARACAIPPDHDAVATWSQRAAGAVVVAGFAECGPDGTLYNSAALVDRTGVRAVYRKTHLWDTEQRWFTAGSAPAPVITTEHGRIGVMVCYDLEFPEMVRSVALRGADLLTVPTNWPWVERPDGLPAPEVVIAMGAARVNRIAIACCDRSGVERGQRWNEASVILGADGWARANSGTSGRAVADVDLVASRNKAVSPRNDVLGDRRPDVY